MISLSSSRYAERLRNWMRSAFQSIVGYPSGHTEHSVDIARRTAIKAIDSTSNDAASNVGLPHPAG